MDNMKNKAFQFIEDHRQEMLDFWQEIVNMESGSTHKAGVDALAFRLKQFLDQAGAATRILEMKNAGNMLVSEIGAARANPAVLFMGHMDTVFPVGTVRPASFYHQGWIGLWTRGAGYERRYCCFSLCDFGAGCRRV